MKDIIPIILSTPFAAVITIPLIFSLTELIYALWFYIMYVNFPQFVDITTFLVKLLTILASC